MLFANSSEVNSNQASRTMAPPLSTDKDLPANITRRKRQRVLIDGIKRENEQDAPASDLKVASTPLPPRSAPRPMTAEESPEILEVWGGTKANDSSPEILQVSATPFASPQSQAVPTVKPEPGVVPSVPPVTPSIRTTASLPFTDSSADSPDNDPLLCRQPVFIKREAKAEPVSSLDATSVPTPARTDATPMTNPYQRYIKQEIKRQVQQVQQQPPPPQVKQEVRQVQPPPPQVKQPAQAQQQAQVDQPAPNDIFLLPDLQPYQCVLPFFVALINVQIDAYRQHAHSVDVCHRLWQVLCQSLQVSVPTRKVPTTHTAWKDHVLPRAALVLEEARQTIADAILRTDYLLMHGYKQTGACPLKVLSSDGGAGKVTEVKFRSVQQYGRDQVWFTNDHLYTLGYYSLVQLDSNDGTTSLLGYVTATPKKDEDGERIGDWNTPVAHVVKIKIVSAVALVKDSAWTARPVEPVAIGLLREFDAVYVAPNQTPPELCDMKHTVVFGQAPDDYATEVAAAPAPVEPAGDVSPMNDSQEAVAKAFLGPYTSPFVIAQG